MFEFPQLQLIVPPEECIGLTSWLDVGKRLICRWVAQAFDEHSFPLGSEQAFESLRELGYDVSRRDFIYASQREGFTPSKTGGRLSWTIDALAQFAMSLERRRRFLPGFHNRKSFHELEEDRKSLDIPMSALPSLAGVIGAGEDLLERIIAEDDADTRNQLLNLYKWTAQGLPEMSNSILEELAGAQDKNTRQIVANILKREVERSRTL